MEPERASAMKQSGLYQRANEVQQPIFEKRATHAMTIHTRTSVFDGRPLAEAWAYDAEGTLLKVVRCDYYGNKDTALEQAEIGLNELLSHREGAKKAGPGAANTQALLIT